MTDLRMKLSVKTFWTVFKYSSLLKLNIIQTDCNLNATQIEQIQNYFKDLFFPYFIIPLFNSSLSLVQ